ncbi:pyridoxal phosphate-dependent transferase [Xylariales sp. PMI_506]|nr:pyridoxal phosphate-dependent transferase [Xylariales sp. PMI_506]
MATNVLATGPALAVQESSLQLQPNPATAVPEPDLEGALQEARAEYISRLAASRSHYENAVKVMPGGNTRSVLFNEPFPNFIKRGSGNRLWDYDSNEYIDLVGELTAGLYGHSHPLLKQTLLSTYENVGVNLGATSLEEVRYAELLCTRFPSVQQLRFCNSGTEANLYALSIAKHVTKKRKVICFAGGYHGGVLSFGHGVAPNTIDKDDWVLGTYNDVAGTVSLIENTPDVAAVIVEAMQGAGGCIPATLKFLQAIQSSAAKSGVLFILDEVMTSRLHPNGLQGKYSLKPDLTTLGKYLGGGLAFGAFGGREDLLAVYDPRNPDSLPHSGTFNNNTLAMACGYVALTEIYTPEVALKHNELGDYFRARLQSVSEGTKMVVTGVGAVLTIHFLTHGRQPVKAEDIDDHSDSGLKKLFWYWCLSHGFWITERGMLSIILGTTRDELESFVDVVSRFAQKHQSVLQLDV